MRRLALVLLLLVACGDGSPTTTTLFESTTGTFQWHDIGQGREIAHLQIDGIDCVVVSKPVSVGVDCDWSEE